MKEPTLPTGWDLLNNIWHIINQQVEEEILLSPDVQDEIEKHIESHVQAHTKELRAALSGIVGAWETLPEGHHTRETIQKWLIKEMHPSIVKAREVLTNEKRGF